MKEELISVVIPVYNVENYLEKCIQSVIDQTYSNLEIILVNDGSTDKSGEICDKYSEIDERIIVIHKKNGGLSDARNTGIDRATGKYIGFVDSDDYIDKEMYSIMYNNIILNDASVSIVNRYYTFPDGKKVLRYKIDKQIKIMNNIEAIEEMNNFSTFDMAAWDKLYEIKLFDDIRFPVGKLSEDFYIMYLIFEKCKKVVFDSRPLYYYFQRDNSITRNKKVNFDFIEAAKQQMNYIGNKYPQLENCVKSAYLSANLTAYNSHLKQKVKLDKEMIKKFKKEVKAYYPYIKENCKIDNIKKIQAKLFLINTNIYNLFFKLYKIKKRI